MAELQHSQIKDKLLEKVGPLIDMSDVGKQADDQLQAHLLSRAIAATALRITADADTGVAAASLVDGGSDNGIDAIYYEPQTRTLFLVQSKWSASHSSSIASGEVLKFLQGVQDLVSLKKERFNQKIQGRWPAIEDALKRLASVRLIVAYPGSGKIDPDIQSKINDFVKSQNDTFELFFFSVISQENFFRFFVQEAAPPRIDLSIKLAHYGLVEHPLKAVYGQLAVSDVADWYKKFGNQLFSGNIRHFLGVKSEVNAGISKTITENPDHFWYFNNGLTIIAQGLAKQAFGGNDRSVGIFDCTNVTVVNGAQTVGTIGQTLANESTAVLPARIIVVDDPASSIGRDITRASKSLTQKPTYARAA